jgi:hypothetical protein
LEPLSTKEAEFSLSASGIDSYSPEYLEAAWSSLLLFLKGNFLLLFLRGFEPRARALSDSCGSGRLLKLKLELLLYPLRL